MPCAFSKIGQSLKPLWLNFLAPGAAATYSGAADTKSLAESIAGHDWALPGLFGHLLLSAFAARTGNSASEIGLVLYGVRWNAWRV